MYKSASEMSQQASKRVAVLAQQLVTPFPCVSDLPLPPIADLPEGHVFPTFPQMRETQQKLGNLFTYRIVGGRRMTFIADPSLYRLVFFPDKEGKVEGDAEKLAYVW